MSRVYSSQLDDVTCNNFPKNQDDALDHWKLFVSTILGRCEVELVVKVNQLVNGMIEVIFHWIQTTIIMHALAGRFPTASQLDPIIEFIINSADVVLLLDASRIYPIANLSESQGGWKTCKLNLFAHIGKGG